MPRGWAPVFSMTVFLQPPLFSAQICISCFIAIPCGEHAGLFGGRVFAWDFDVSIYSGSHSASWSTRVQLKPTSQVLLVGGSGGHPFTKEVGMCGAQLGSMPGGLQVEKGI